MFQLLAGMLAFFYDIVPNYAIAIGLLTLTVMLVLSPLTIKSTRSMLAMQKLQPELKRLQAEHKGDRQKLNEAMMALYKEHKVNPVAGCLPMLLQAPVFIVMYQVIRGMTRVGDDGVFDPKYLDVGSRLHRDLAAAGGQMKSFGIDLAKNATGGHDSLVAALPYFILVALVVFLQFYQTRQTMARNKNAAANPQQQILLKVMPAFFGLISLTIQAALNIYFLVSSAFRISQTAAMYRFDPAVSAHAKAHAAEAAAAAELAANGKRPAKNDPANGKRPAKNDPAKAVSPKSRGTKGKPTPSGSGRARAQPGGVSNGRTQPRRKSKKGR